MNLDKALAVFGYDRSTRIDEIRLKSDFRELAKKRHPDVGGSKESFVEVKEAFDTIMLSVAAPKATVESIVKKYVSITLLEYNQLIKNGVVEAVGRNGERFILKEEFMWSYEIELRVIVNYIYGGVSGTLTGTVKTNQKNVYEASFNMESTGEENGNELILYVGDQEIKTQLSTAAVMLKTKCYGFIELKVNIRKW